MNSKNYKKKTKCSHLPLVHLNQNNELYSGLTEFQLNDSCCVSLYRSVCESGPHFPHWEVIA